MSTALATTLSGALECQSDWKMSKTRQRYRSPKDTCFSCRTRKVRCNGRGDSNTVCGNCERLDLPCLFLESSPSSHPPTVIPRKRGRSACHHCHERKIRCSGELPRCRRCLSLDLECVYPPRKKARSDPGNVVLLSEKQDEPVFSSDHIPRLSQSQDSTGSSAAPHDSPGEYGGDDGNHQGLQGRDEPWHGYVAEQILMAFKLTDIDPLYPARG